ncbi:MAG: hypothetical protein R2710_13000 [Acidimicrobiales bacterium]
MRCSSRRAPRTRNCYFIISGETDVLFSAALLGPTGAGQPEGEMAMFFRQPLQPPPWRTRHRHGSRPPAAAFDELQRTNPELRTASKPNYFPT